MTDRAYPTRPIVGVGAVILVPREDAARIGVDGHPPEVGVVLIRRRFEPLAGQWSLPGGTVEVGETLDAAVAREALEETGLAVDVGAVVEVFDRILFDADRRVQYHFVLIDYLCRPRSGVLTCGSDASEVTLADVRALAAFELTEKALAVIRRSLELSAGDL